MLHFNFDSSLVEERALSGIRTFGPPNCRHFFHACELCLSAQAPWVEAPRVIHSLALVEAWGTTTVR